MSVPEPTKGAGGVRCAECGARYADAGDSCAARFDALLALDHSRQEPWGSRHGLAFAAFALQHPLHYPASRSRSLELLTRVFIRGETVEQVVQEFRRRPDLGEPADATPVARTDPHAPFAITIADLGDFDAASYAAKLEAWCRATLDGL